MLLKQKLPLGYVLGQIKTQIIWLVLYSTVVYVAHLYFELEAISVPLAIPSILGTIISLLLAFRSNQAYDRWWEARILWGRIVNDSRSYARQVITFLDNSYDEEDKAKMKHRLIKRQIAWCYSLSSHLRGQDTLSSYTDRVSENEKEILAEQDNTPFALLEQHGTDLRLLHRLGWINDVQQIAIDETLTKFSDSMGGCERIKNTVFPTTYSVYIHFLMVLFVLIIPFSLMEFFGIFQIPLVVAISSSFFLIEKMSIHLQDPFENKPSDTPTFSISKTIEKNLNQMLKVDQKSKVDQENVPSVTNKTVFFVL